MPKTVTYDTTLWVLDHAVIPEVAIKKGIKRR